MKDSMFDVTVVGLGPVGSLGAIFLAHAGLKVAAVERDRDVYRLPRAVNLDGEIVRGLQRVGLGDDIDVLLQKLRPDEMVGFANSNREMLFGQKPKAFGVNGWQPMNMFDQPEVEQFLRDTALSHPNVSSYVGHTADALEQDESVVRLSCRTEADDVVVLESQYLLGCDGASSFARRELGIRWRDLGYDKDWLVVDITTKDGHTLDNRTLQVCDPDRLATYVCTKDPYRRWEFKLNDGETWDEMLEPDKIRSLIDTWTPAGTYEIRRAAVYQFHAVNAEAWRAGRVLLAGDAAHQTPPFLGQGMNSGMRDVINLGWKLPLVVQGHAAADLLDTYQEERDAHTHDLVDWAVSIGRLMEHLAEVEAASRTGQPEPATPPDLRESGYGQGREQPPLRRGVLVDSQVGHGAGALFSQPILADGRKLDELLGPGFAIVTKSSDIVLNASSHETLERLRIPIVSLAGLTAAKGHFDRAFEGTSTVVVRPDRYIFGYVTEELQIDDLLVQLTRSLHVS